VALRSGGWFARFLQLLERQSKLARFTLDAGDGDAIELAVVQPEVLSGVANAASVPEVAPVSL